jgi:hypothetical protein
MSDGGQDEGQTTINKVTCTTLFARVAQRVEEAGGGVEKGEGEERCLSVRLVFFEE